MFALNLLFASIRNAFENVDEISKTFTISLHQSELHTIHHGGSSFSDQPHSSSSIIAAGIAKPDGFTDSGSDHNALPERCQRVNQLDAIVLDNELNSSLKAQFVRIFKYLPMDIVMRYEVEMEYFIRSLIYYFSVHRERGLNGDKLQNIRFQSRLSVKQKRLYFVLAVLLPYCFRFSAS